MALCFLPHKAQDHWHGMHGPPCSDFLSGLPTPLPSSPSCPAACVVLQELVVLVQPALLLLPLCLLTPFRLSRTPLPPHLSPTPTWCSEALKYSSKIVTSNKKSILELFHSWRLPWTLQVGLGTSFLYRCTILRALILHSLPCIIIMSLLASSNQTMNSLKGGSCLWIWEQWVFVTL